MLWVLCVIFALLWGAGLANGYAFAGAIHILLALAISALALEVISSRSGFSRKSRSAGWISRLGLGPCIACLLASALIIGLLAGVWNMR